MSAFRSKPPFSTDQAAQGLKRDLLWPISAQAVESPRQPLPCPGLTGDVKVKQAENLIVS